MDSFWFSLDRPFFVLAPMEDVTDTVFRHMVARCAKPDVWFTEFTSCDGLLSRGHDAVASRLTYSSDEHPIVAQIWGNNPDSFYAATKELASLGFDGIDINMGCPVRDVVGDGCGASLIRTPEVAKAIIAATKQGISQSGKDIALSVKTRIGYGLIETASWVRFLLEQGIDALTIHGRTAKEKSKVPAHWDEIAKAVMIRNTLRVNSVIIGNGDVKNVQDGLVKVRDYGVDGIMIGRGIFTDMWAFDRREDKHIPTKRELLSLMDTHIRLFSQTWGDAKPFETLRKFFKIYINGFLGASEMRDQAMKLQTKEEAYDFIEELKHNV
jgi:tRNA-dihydrouridine synthase